MTLRWNFFPEPVWPGTSSFKTCRQDTLGTCNTSVVVLQTACQLRIPECEEGTIWMCVRRIPSKLLMLGTSLKSHMLKRFSVTSENISATWALCRDENTM